MRYLSPLRYPGGKGRLAPYIARLISAQPVRPHSYAEPFAGGAGAALRLLVDEHVRSIHINDLDPGIAAFWRCVFNETDRFVHLIETTEIGLDTWHRSKEIYTDTRDSADIDLGFATFVLNRCNRSGILTARPIGGMQQTGTWKIDARFNRVDLADRVRRLGRYRGRVTVSQLDARVFIKTIDDLGDRVLLYVDPPYLVQGDDLYLDGLTIEDHADLAQLLRECRCPWLLTYDRDDRVPDQLYTGLPIAEFDIAHTAQHQHVGSEFMVFGPSVTVPSLDVLGATHALWLS